MIIALIRFYFFIPKKPDLDFALDQSIEIIGVVSDYPDERLKNDRVIITPKNYKANLLIILPSGSEVFYGDEIKVKGILESPENFITSSGKEFNYERYLANKDIYYIVKNASAEIVSSDNGSKIKLLLFKFRKIFTEKIVEIISSPESDLGRGLILGDRGGFDSSIQENFIKTGTIHIVALSGFNVTIIANAVIKTFSIILSQNLSMIFGGFFILLFILISGGGTTIIRAGIMAFIAIFARITGRNYLAGRALVIAGLLMFSYDPRVITDMSFQFSFLATFGILYITPKIIKYFYFVPIRFMIRENLTMTISATLAVLPLLLYSTGIFSLVSIPANILIIPIIPLAMFFTFLSGLLGMISHILALPFGFIAEKILAYILFVIEKFGNLSFASISFSSFPIVFTIILYILIFWWVFKKK